MNQGITVERLVQTLFKGEEYADYPLFFGGLDREQIDWNGPLSTNVFLSFIITMKDWRYLSPWYAFFSGFPTPMLGALLK